MQDKYSMTVKSRVVCGTVKLLSYEYPELWNFLSYEQIWNTNVYAYAYF